MKKIDAGKIPYNVILEMPKRKFYSEDRHGSTAHYDKKAKIGILSEDIMSYYRNVSSSLENGFEEDSDLKGMSTGLFPFD